MGQLQERRVSERPLYLAPSVLSADFTRLGDQVREVIDGGADYIHVDVMDGRFVPNISIGFPILEAIRSVSTVPIDVHLMIVEPDRYVERFVAAGADIVTVHVEACVHLHRTVQSIAALGATAGVTLNPGTALGAIEEIVPNVGQVLIMSVNPGFGGQAFIPSALDRIRRVRRWIDERNPECRLEVDGGISVENIADVVDAGANMIVAGSAVFASGSSIGDAIIALRSSAGRSGGRS
jgi:ribulose-phosphate 3-epimerase